MKNPMPISRLVYFKLFYLSVVLLFLISALTAPAIAASSSAVTASEGTLQLPTYPWWPAVPHPYFRGTDGRNIYPYPMMDNLIRTSEPHTWRTVVLENEYLRVTFLPELGGRVYEVVDKIGHRSMFYVNHVVKPGLIGQCGAWISGGIEFNTGPAGHTVSAVMPVDVEILPPEADGSRSVAVGEVEKIYRTRWTAVVTLRPGRTFLEETIRIHNGTETVRPYYFWNCTAMPNHHGFRFVYPMTLGSDHGSEKFFTWPIDHGKDLSLGRNYEDASSIFARECDQDFFGSYDEDEEYGVVAYANHQLLPGKKAWTWGQGGYGTMHQKDLTDADGPYNEVQTGPLLTQGEVGRLDPGESVRWQEWWYPVRAMGGFNFANRDLAANASCESNTLHLRLIGTGTSKSARVQVLKNGHELGASTCDITPLRSTDIRFDLKRETEPFEIKIRGERGLQADFRVPLDLPVRTPPTKPQPPSTAEEFAQTGWQEFLFAKFGPAEASFRRALTNDAKSVDARVGLAFILLERDPAAAKQEAIAAVQTNPNSGLAHYVLAVALERETGINQAIDHAWKAALDPATAVSGRALAAKLYIKNGDWDNAIKALSDPGPWRCDTVCRNRLAFACLQAGQRKEAIGYATQNIAEDPLDASARSILWLAKAEPKNFTLKDLIAGKPQSCLDLAAEFLDVGQPPLALNVLEEFYFNSGGISAAKEPIANYWAAYLSAQLNKPENAERYLKQARAASPLGVFPHRRESLPVLRWAINNNPKDGHATLFLGHLQFSLGNVDEGRNLWLKAADLGAAPAIALRAVGMSYHQLDNNEEKAATYLEKANRIDPADAIVARDLAQTLFALADKAAATNENDARITQARDVLKKSFANGRGRADCVALLATAHSRLGHPEETAKLLDSVRITIWEGGRDVHNLFEEAHLALAKTHAEAGRHDQALAEYNRALEYPENLATGKMETDRQAHIQYLRGNELAALGRKAEAAAAWKLAAEEPASSDSKIEEARQKARQALNKM